MTELNKRKTMIVTGASQGIGTGVTKAFIKRGYNVVANSRKISRLRAEMRYVGRLIADLGEFRRINVNSLRRGNDSLF